MASQVFNFGVGALYGRRTDVANTTPYHFGTVQDCSISLDQALVELYGSLKFPVDVAPGKGKITGKAKKADLNAQAMNNLFWGQTLTTAAGEQVAINEVHAIPGTPFQVTIAPPASGTFIHDLGVYYVLTGTPLLKVASAPATGQYAANDATGVYTFAAADTGLSVGISYSYTTTTNTQIAIANVAMGTGPTFEFHAQSQYTNSLGTLCTLNVRLNACRASKSSLDLKNDDFTMDDFEFQAFADTAGNIGLITVNQ